ncbi:FmdE family protein [Desulfosediminicola flagellatus]|uniref:FmdE family protein n=1 Tax=Desulfosediminicola flagellatus TaxID=2569541 RepID=UPI0010AD16C2|nr:FmdE family protein [Desulfosediminicola flagellatus]
MESFDALLEESTRIHGHVCPGQVLGVRMSLLGLKLINVTDPKGRDRKNIYVFVEIDRCATDAIQSVTGCSAGKRTLKLIDHGVMAATFVNLENDKAVRITALEESRELSKKYCGHILDKRVRQLEAYKIMPDAELFSIQHVEAKIPPEDLPGRPIKRVQCQGCGDWVQDNRDVVKDGQVLCRRCSGKQYFSLL